MPCPCSICTSTWQLWTIELKQVMALKLLFLFETVVTRWPQVCNFDPSCLCMSDSLCRGWLSIIMLGVMHCCLMPRRRMAFCMTQPGMPWSDSRSNSEAGSLCIIILNMQEHAVRPEHQLACASPGQGYMFCNSCALQDSYLDKLQA